MNLKIIAFGIARDIVGGSEISFQVDRNQSNINDLRTDLRTQFPDFKKLASLRFAVNEEYVSDDYVLSPNDVVVLIPPVSGG